MHNCQIHPCNCTKCTHCQCQIRIFRLHKMHALRVITTPEFRTNETAELECAKTDFDIKCWGRPSPPLWGGPWSALCNGARHFIHLDLVWITQLNATCSISKTMRTLKFTNGANANFIGHQSTGLIKHLLADSIPSNSALSLVLDYLSSIDSPTFHKQVLQDISAICLALHFSCHTDTCVQLVLPPPNK